MIVLGNQLAELVLPVIRYGTSTGPRVIHFLSGVWTRDSSEQTRDHSSTEETDFV